MIKIIREYCPYCESNYFRKVGVRYNQHGIVQHFQCLDCRKTFTDRRDEFKKMRYDEEKITQAVWLFLSGMSARQIQKKLKIGVSHNSIIRWVKRFKENPKFQINASHRPEVREKIAIGVKNYFSRGVSP